ncbi:F-box domain-containing protein [Sodiomyces alkalinus F11]|uniref:F-box domain-containing protein n=1 Tax=Sodiomyces alkalinus (strain CBS 110278 / VKM F-3762 / F11) TaxID=1314773 RepID=A0A3N2PME8_SODAK|nr:F-box domain-containing protein [Sodiomyces alkalinus F11]ROT35711.1 F-box domain-containing protein [Sodiomyces alkalinus F11]
MEMADEQTPVNAEGPVKKKNRQRLLHRIQRISSFPSLPQTGRPRAHSSPYRTRDTLSCASLTGSMGAGVPYSSDSYFPPGAMASGYASASSSLSASPASDMTLLGGDDCLNVRKIGTPTSFPSNYAVQTVGLPPDIRTAIKTHIANPAIPKRDFKFWDHMPHEVRLYVFSFFLPMELVRASRVSKMFYNICFDGQLWTNFDASEFYRDIPAESLAKIIKTAGPFIKSLNLRGCVQVEHYKQAEVVFKSCKNLVDVSLEGCRNFHRTTLHGLVKANHKLTTLNLTGLASVTNISCRIIANSCPQLQMLNVSWCPHLDSRGIKAVVKRCPNLADLRAREVRGFDMIDVAAVLFRTNNLERLVLNGCADLTDSALKVMIHGENPEFDILSDIPIVPPRKWRHVDLSRCKHLTDRGVQALGHLTPNLEGLQLSGCTALTDAALTPIVASAPRLTHLELEDLTQLTNTFLSEHLAKAPCAPFLEHLSLSYCENLGDTGVLPLVKNCVQLKSIDLDNTRISDLVLAEAAYMVNKRSKLNTDPSARPRVGLHMVVYDCHNVTWTGVREVLFRNSYVKSSMVDDGTKYSYYPAEVISLKCFYGFQMTVDEHLKRVLRGDFAAAARLERRWADWMQANEEAGTTGAGHRRRRRRAREAQMLHADEEEGGVVHVGRRRARTIPSCTLM